MEEKQPHQTKLTPAGKTQCIFRGKNDRQWIQFNDELPVTD